MAHRIGIIGLGKIAQDQHVPVIRANPAFELVARVEPTRPSASTACRMPSRIIARCWRSPDLDAVAICTPPQVRHAIARDAIEAGKHVLLEKPPTATLSELEDLRRLGERAGTVVFTTWHSQYNSARRRGPAGPRGRAREAAPRHLEGGRAPLASGPAMDLGGGRLRRVRPRHQRALHRDEDHARSDLREAGAISSFRRTGTRRSPPVSPSRPATAAANFAPSSTGARPVRRAGTSRSRQKPARD